MIREFIKQVRSDKLVKVTSLNIITTVVRMLTSLFTNKLVAILLGTYGFVLLGQMGNAYTMAMTFVTAISVGLTKYISEYGYDKTKVSEFINTAFTVLFLYYLIIIILSFLFSKQVSFKLLNNTKYSYVIIITGITFIGAILNSFYLSIINGLQAHKLYVKINILNSIAMALYTILLIYFFKEEGAIISSVTYLSFCFLVTFFYINKIGEFKVNYLQFKFSKNVFYKLLLFSIMPMLSGIFFPLSQVIIRNLLITEINIDSAGYWEAISRISNMFVLTITTSLSIYFLPKLSETTGIYLNDEILNALRKIMPVFIVLTIFIIILQDFIILTLFTSKFLPMKELFLLQFTGNIFKVAGWIIAYRMLAKAMIKDYILTELLFYFVYIFSSIFLIHKFGTIGSVLSYAFSYLIYFIYLSLRFKVFFKKSIHG